MDRICRVLTKGTVEPEVYLNNNQIEKDHWWFAARRRIIVSFIRSHLALPPNAKILDAGCGTGGNLEALSAFGDVTGLEPDETAARMASNKGVSSVVCGRLEDDLPFEKGDI